MTSFEVSSEAIASYQQEGAVLIEGAFRQWVPRLLAAHDRLVEKLERVASDGPGGRTARINNPPGCPPLTYNAQSGGMFGVRNAVFADSDFFEWMRDSPAAAIVGQVVGAKTVQFWWDQSFCKTADARPEAATPWHTDSGSFSFVGNMLPSFWIAGTDVGPDNSPLLTVVGSHRDTRWFRPVFGKDDVKLLPENYAERTEILNVVAKPDTQIRTWTMRAGDCLVIHPYTYHASARPAPGAGRRIGLTSRWLGDDIRWKLRDMTFTYPDDPRFANIRQDQPPPTDAFPVLWRAP